MGCPATVRLAGVRLCVELDLLTFLQLIEGRLFNGVLVEEHLFCRAVGLDEAKPPVADDALDCPDSNAETPSSRMRFAVRMTCFDWRARRDSNSILPSR